MHPVAAILWIGTLVITGAIVFGLAHVIQRQGRQVENQHI